MMEFSLLLHLNSIKFSLEKTADISQPLHHWFPREMTSGKRVQEFHTDEYVRHYRDLGSACDWLKQISHAPRPISYTTQIWVVTRHQYGISALVSPGPRHFGITPLYKDDMMYSLQCKASTGFSSVNIFVPLNVCFLCY